MGELVVGEKFAHRVGDQCGRGLVSSKEQAVEERGDLVIGDLVPFGLEAHEVGHEIVARGGLGIGDQLAAETPVRDEVLGVRDLLVVGQVAPGDRRA